MQWSVRRPFVPPVALDRLRLRRAALRLAAHGWAVTPGARLSGHRFDCGRPGCPITACHPALESWEDTASTDPAQVRAWWRHEPYSLLLVTGRRFDAIEVPAALGLRVLGAVRLNRRGDARGPVTVTAAGRWSFLVEPGAPLRSELDHRLDVVRHGLGSWIPAAPSRMLEGPARWAVTPEQAQWRLPGAETVQQLMTDALGTVRERQLTVPRQLSTARRGG
ncbi:bifunctional DNA primase/polymerase [Paractinoplanes brasiliensis]|uniref:Bifunctional DNA primase/polymerase-like protein n=1 Tax=Paractinoplanes brasiliensis TaxID=52695 RepID=A0A4R6JN63_9ACTN|nr:bifunctional DNA primase/polymerase [Actinoplanes brasiliensis]TDO37903.1 bifunctional DNA primase/polymerase-like protein [Actinoplanes brasiliensis]GID32958.1 DNA primase [Actinoplanes brasiliensis]